MVLRRESWHNSRAESRAFVGNLSMGQRCNSRVGDCGDEVAAPRLALFGLAPPCVASPRKPGTPRPGGRCPPRPSCPPHIIVMLRCNITNNLLD